MRGKGGLAGDELSRDGITPAYAGKSTEREDKVAERKDHPRICGEKALTLRFWGPPSGSPPHMRGKVRLCYRLCHSIRITPAYAGKSNRSGKHGTGKQDHPRICGEKTKKIP